MVSCVINCLHMLLVKSFAFNKKDITNIVFLLLMVR